MKRIRFLNPRSDRSFVQLVEDTLRTGVATPQELQARLRTVHPKTVVRERGLYGDVSPNWYVYREGHWVPDPEVAEGERADFLKAG